MLKHVTAKAQDCAVLYVCGLQEVLLIRKLPVDTHQLWAAVREQGGHEKV